MEPSVSLFKVVTVGQASGKTSILLRYVKDAFSNNVHPTVGVEFFSKTEILNKEEIKLHLWDTTSQERYRGIVSAHYRKAAGVLLVFDIGKVETFQAIERWREEVASATNTVLVWYLLGNKCDMENRKVTFEQAKSYAEMNNMKYFEISALTGEYVNEVFRQLAVDLLMMQDLSAPVKNQTIVKEANKETITFLNVFESMKKKVASIVEDKPKNSNISTSSQVQSESSSKVKIKKSFFDDVKKAVGQIKLPKYLDDSDNDNKKPVKEIIYREVPSTAGDDNKVMCFMCYDGPPNKKLQTSRCGHLACNPCWMTWLESKSECPMCAKYMRADELITLHF